MAYDELMTIEDRCRLIKTVYDRQYHRKNKCEVKFAR